MRVKNVSDLARELDDVEGRDVLAEPGEIIEVPDQLGESLCEQPANWQRVDEEPSGDTVAAILEWVGDDHLRAAAALDAERERSRPRSSLIDRLEELLEAGADEGDDETDGAPDEDATDDGGDAAPNDEVNG